MKNPLTKKVLVFPDFVTSESDGDIHFISAAKLLRLYGVLRTDIIRIYDPKNRIPLSGGHWIELYPRKDGSYYNIHEHD